MFAIAAPSIPSLPIKRKLSKRFVPVPTVRKGTIAPCLFTTRSRFPRMVEVYTNGMLAISMRNIYAEGRYVSPRRMGMMIGARKNDARATAMPPKKLNCIEESAMV